VTGAAQAEVRERALAPLDRLEDARRLIGEAAMVVEVSCGSTTRGS
jgi:hypothetical protein